MTRADIIYGLLDPVTGECRYVGKTGGRIDKRLKGHLSDARRRKFESIPRFRWINSLSLSLPPRIVELERCERDWREAEVEWIAVMKREGARLLNCTDGGEGAEGYKHSPEMRARMSKVATALAKDPQLRELRSIALKAAYAKPEVKARLSKALKAAASRPEVKDRMRRAQKMSCNRPEIKAQRSASLKGRTISPEWRAKISASKTGLKMSDEAVAAMSAGHLGLKHSEETKAKIREAAKRRYGEKL